MGSSGGVGLRCSRGAGLMRTAGRYYGTQVVSKTALQVDERVRHILTVVDD